MADEIYNKLQSEAKRLVAVKEQILIRYLGLGPNEAHHPWLQEGTAFSSSRLLDHLKNKVIPLANDLEIPKEPPLTLPAPPPLSKLGTQTNATTNLKIANEEKIAEFKANAHAERST